MVESVASRVAREPTHLIFILKPKDDTSRGQLGSEHIFGLRQAARAVQPHLRVDGAEGLKHADPLQPLVDGAQLKRPAWCGGERGVPRGGCSGACDCKESRRCSSRGCMGV